MKTKKKLVYIAGPYTNPDPVANTHKAIRIGNLLSERGYAVFIPHLTLIWHLVSPKPLQFWYDHDIELLYRCDLLYRIKGSSKGADEEVRVAEEFGIPVIYEKGAGDILLMRELQ